MNLRWQHLLLIVPCILLSACGQSSSTSDPELVFGNLGIICIGPDVEAGQAKILDSINKAADNVGLTRVSMKSSGSPELSRTSYEFENSQGKSVRLDVVDREGSDLRVLVTADGHLRELIVDAIWTEFAPQIN